MTEKGSHPIGEFMEGYKGELSPAHSEANTEAAKELNSGIDQVLSLDEKNTREKSPESKADISRRHFLKVATALAIIGGGVAAGVFEKEEISEALGRVSNFLAKDPLEEQLNIQEGIGREYAEKIISSRREELIQSLLATGNTSESAMQKTLEKFDEHVKKNMPDANFINRLVKEHESIR